MLHVVINNQVPALKAVQPNHNKKDPPVLDGFKKHCKRTHVRKDVIRDMKVALYVRVRCRH